MRQNNDSILLHLYCHLSGGWIFKYTKQCLVKLLDYQIRSHNKCIKMQNFSAITLYFQASSLQFPLFILHISGPNIFYPSDTSWILFSNNWVLQVVTDEKPENKIYKLVETFHVFSECRTAVYFNWWLSLQFGQPRWLWLWLWQLSSCRFIFRQSESLHLATETEQDHMRLSLLQ
jgi:hypothetical protein